jgi:hypothetical protein
MNKGAEIDIVITVALSTVLLLAFSFSNLANAQFAEGYETYTNEDYNFTIDYPSDWVIQESNLQPYQVVKFLTSENVPAAISIFMGKINQDMTLYQAANDTEGINIKLISMTNTTVGDTLMPAVKQTFYQYEFDKSVKVKKVHTLSNQDLISIRYITELQDFEEYLQEFDHMVQSFRMGVS